MVGLLLAFWVSPARAVPEAVRIGYDAPAGCPGEAVFLEQLKERIPELRLAEPGDAARTFSVRVERVNGGFAGRLSIIELDGSETTRDADADACDDLTAALSLILALAVDPHGASGAETPPDSAVPDRETGATPGSSTDAAADTGASGSQRGPAAGASKYEVDVGVSASLPSGLAPGLMIGRGLYARIAFGPKAPLSPQVRLSLQTAGQRSFEEREGTATFGWWGGSLDTCVFGASLGGGFSARPCLGLELGRLLAEGSETTNPRSESDVWFGAGGSLEVELQIARVASIQVFGALLAPANRKEFLLGEDVVHSIPAVAWRVGLRLGAVLD